jgi:hypothetical protein
MNRSEEGKLTGVRAIDPPRFASFEGGIALDTLIYSTNSREFPLGCVLLISPVRLAQPSTYTRSRILALS